MCSDTDARGVTDLPSDADRWREIILDAGIFEEMGPRHTRVEEEVLAGHQCDVESVFGDPLVKVVGAVNASADTEVDPRQVADLVAEGEGPGPGDVAEGTGGASTVDSTAAEGVGRDCDDAFIERREFPDEAVEQWRFENRNGYSNVDAEEGKTIGVFKTVVFVDQSDGEGGASAEGHVEPERYVSGVPGEAVRVIRTCIALNPPPRLGGSALAWDCEPVERIIGQD